MADTKLTAIHLFPSQRKYEQQKDNIKPSELAMLPVDTDLLRGKKGRDGSKGAKGDNGRDGKDGKGVYELAVEQGFQGSKKDFLTSLKGEKGDKGDKGDKGADGKDGGGSYTFATEDFNSNDNHISLASAVLKKDANGVVNLATGQNTTGALNISFGKNTIPSIVAQGSIWTGAPQTSAYAGVYARRLCTDDANKTNTAGFIVNSDGAAKFVHKRGDVAIADDAQLIFDATKLQYQAAGTKGGYLANAPIYDIVHTGNISKCGLVTKEEVKKMIQDAIAGLNQ